MKKNFKRMLLCIPVAICMVFTAALSACIVGEVEDPGTVPGDQEGVVPDVPGEDEGTTPGTGNNAPSQTPDDTTGGEDQTPSETPGVGDDTTDNTPGGTTGGGDDATGETPGDTTDGTAGGEGQAPSDTPGGEDDTTDNTPGGNPGGETETPEPGHIHSMVKTDAVEATEGADGHTAYWYCEECSKYFADEEGAVETSLDEVVTHYLVHVPAQASTSAATGNTEYWECSNCHKYFADAEGADEITDKTSVIIPVHAAAVVVHVVLPSTVTIDSSYDAYISGSNTIMGFTTQDTLTSADLPSASQLADSNDNGGYLAAKTFIGWYLKQTDAETGAVTNTIIGDTETTGVSLADATEITVAPYYHIYGTDTMVANNSPGKGNTTSYNGVTWNGVSSYSTTADKGGKDHSWECIVTQQDNKVVLDPASPGGYATLGTAAKTDGITFTTGDVFRFTAAVSFDPRDDNVEIYRFQNFGTDTIKLKSCLTNSGVEIETSNTTNAVYIYLAPGETAEYVWSSEYGAGSNQSMMIDFEAMDSFTMDMGVSMAYVTSTDTGHVDASLSGIYTQLQGAGYNMAAADLNTTDSDIGESNFVACLTSSTTYNGLTDTPVEASSELSYESIDLAAPVERND